MEYLPSIWRCLALLCAACSSIRTSSSPKTVPFQQRSRHSQQGFNAEASSKWTKLWPPLTTPSISCVSDSPSAGCWGAKAKGTAFYFCLWQSLHWTASELSAQQKHKINIKGTSKQHAWNRISERERHKRERIVLIKANLSAIISSQW